MHSINEIDCYFSGLKVIFDIEFFGASLLFIFICIYLLGFCLIFVFLIKQLSKPLLFTSAIFSSEYDIKPTFNEDYFRERSRSFEKGCKLTSD